MKKSILSVICACAVAMTFTSCDEDTVKSMVLSGEWEGDFGMYYTLGGRTYECYDTYLQFEPDYLYATTGTGCQVDYYDYGPYDYQYYRFTWRVENSDIYLEYPHDPQLDVTIRDYKMSNTLLTGKLASGTRISLSKLTDYYDWTPYVDEYGCHENPDWRQAPARGADVDASQIKAGRRF